ncbi:MAG TPA: peptidoglycan-binding protein [Phycisphaerae bacterium]|nr:peptidoglycan-binding protein [Phycisphaerae bacterium]
MASPAEMATYYEGHPDPDDAATWGTKPDGQPYGSFEEAKGGFEAAKGPAPTPAPVAGAPSPGAGMPAARLTDTCAHGGAVVGPGEPTVLIGNLIAVRAMPANDMALCPMFDGLVPHVSGVILKGSNSVLIGKFPAARVADPIGPPVKCAGNQIAKGCDTVLIGDSGGGGGSGPGGGGGGDGGGAPGAAEAGEAPAEEAQPDYADTKSEEQPPGSSTQNVGQGTHWVSFELVDEAEKPVVGEQYEIRLPDAKVVKGALDPQGKVKVSGLKEAGTAAIKFPKLDLAAWERWKPAPAAEPQTVGDGAPEPPPPEEQTVPVPRGSSAQGGRWHEALPGECISSLAADHGHFVDTIWNHANNAELKRRRVDPNVLLPRDAVFIPDKRPKEESGPTDQHHKFKRRGEPSKVVVFLMLNDEPLANKEYELTIDGKASTGTTDANGRVAMFIPGNAKTGVIKVKDDDFVHEYNLALGKLDPISSISGIQQRLNNLGYDCGKADGIIGPRTIAALERFQAAKKLEVTGKPDQPTKNKLQELHKT